MSAHHRTFKECNVESVQDDQSFSSKSHGTMMNESNDVLQWCCRIHKLEAKDLSDESVFVLCCGAVVLPKSKPKGPSLHRWCFVERINRHEVIWLLSLGRNHNSLRRFLMTSNHTIRSIWRRQCHRRRQEMPHWQHWRHHRPDLHTQHSNLGWTCERPTAISWRQSPSSPMAYCEYVVIRWTKQAWRVAMVGGLDESKRLTMVMRMEKEIVCWAK